MVIANLIDGNVSKAITDQKGAKMLVNHCVKYNNVNQIPLFVKYRVFRTKIKENQLL